MNTIWKAQLLVLVLLASAALWPQAGNQTDSNPSNAAPATLNRVRVSPGAAAGNLTHKVLPEYPREAKENRIQGQVQLCVIIDRQGQVKNVQTVSGHPYLVPAATDAVKQWRYKPYLLNREPVEVETTVVVNFNLAPPPDSASSITTSPPPRLPQIVPQPAQGTPTAATVPASNLINHAAAGVPQKIDRVRVSGGVAESHLIHKVIPEYPEQAKQSRIQGTVILRAVIDKSGNIIELTPISGHPMLVPTAVDAVRQWRYSPYILNGDPVEVETTVTVNFNLAGS